MAGKPFYTGECNVKIIPKKALSFVCLADEFGKCEMVELQFSDKEMPVQLVVFRDVCNNGDDYNCHL